MAPTSGIIKILIQLLSLQAIYQSSPEKIRLEFPGLVLRLLFEAESGVQELVRGVRKVWEQERETKLEVNSSDNICLIPKGVRQFLENSLGGW